MQKSVIAVSNNLYDGMFDQEKFVVIDHKDNLTTQYLNKVKPEYIFFPHWSYIIPAEIYENFSCVIFHMTDLPFGRGGSPLQNLISRGIYKTKISAIKCVKKLDAGDVYLKRDFDISYGTAEEIYKRAGLIIKEMIDEIIKGKQVPKKQEGEIVEFKRRKPDESNIQSLSNITQVYDYIRMLDAQGYPRAFLETDDIRFEFDNAEFKDDEICATVRIKKKND